MFEDGIAHYKPEARPPASPGLALQSDGIVSAIFANIALPSRLSMPAASAISATAASAAGASPFLFGTGFIDCKIAPLHCKCI